MFSEQVRERMEDEVYETAYDNTTSIQRKHSQIKTGTEYEVSGNKGTAAGISGEVVKQPKHGQRSLPRYEKPLSFRIEASGSACYRRI